MRTVDPDVWYRKVRKPLRVRERLRFGSYQASNFEIRLRTSFVDTMKDLGWNISISGVRFILKTKQPIRQVYLLVTMVALASAMWLTVVSVNVFRQQPTLVVNLQPLQQPLRYVPFPAVALCSYNLISKKALKTYARRLVSLDNNGTYTLSQIENNLLAFGALVPRNPEPFDLHFMKFLADFDKETNVTNIMLKLSPDCHSMLVRCSWQAQVVPCRQLFAVRITANGFCCVMNSRYRPEDAKRKPKRAKEVGQDQGLMVIVKEDIQDSAYLRRPCHDVEVTLFDGKQYPLIESSGVRSYPAHQNALVYFKLRFELHYLTNQLRYYSEAWRGCRTPASGWGRSEAACILECRRRAILALCSCVPFTFQPEHGQRVCSPEHLACLSKHHEKLTYYNPGGAADASLASEQSSGADCAHCRPDCTRLVFSAPPAQAHYDRAPNGKLFTNKLLWVTGQLMVSNDHRPWTSETPTTHITELHRKGVNLVNSTVIRIFYSSKENYVFYMLETNLRYFEDIASLSSQWILLCGAGLVSVWELVYFCSIRWYQHYRRRQHYSSSRRTSAMNIDYLY